ncbi:MAG TPA: alpha/beta fold hydrolase, partial [Bacteroidia bacterium]|nr:alpha/beta fold hydrolase [Bacteroidia bacterium]
MSYKSLKKGAITWNWKEYGRGAKYLLAFPGFSRSPEDYHSFGKWMGAEDTILAFELFFHGHSEVKYEDEPPVLTYQLLKDLMDEILERYKITEFELLAYSFGGRLALNLVEIYGSRVKG